MYPVHHHGAWLNKDGNGNTDLSSGHFHRVREFQVQADPSDGHVHQLTTLPCGHGQPRTVGRDGQMQLQLGDGGTQLAPVQQQIMRAPQLSMWPWVAGAVMVTGLVIGGILLMRSDET